MYLAKTLTISIIESPEDILGWEQSSKFKINIDNAPENYAKRIDEKKGDPKREGEGEVNVIAWLDAGELITVASSSDEGRYKRTNSSGRYGWCRHAVDFTIELKPFRTDESWLKISNAGNSIATMNWMDEVNFDTETIDLVKFLPAEIKVDEFIDDFCKAFNLNLYQTKSNEFSLDVKPTKKTLQNEVIAIDEAASIRDKSNESLALPSVFSLGFTIDNEEEGLAKANGDDGGGNFRTGSEEDTKIEQKSKFSYNWFKEIKKKEKTKTEPIAIPLPVISKAEVWTQEMAYHEAMNKRYTNLAQRFWYFDGLLNDLGATFHLGQNESNTPLMLAKVSNTLPDMNTLSYKNEENTILTNYFSLLANAKTDYTTVECYLQPDEYVKIGEGALVRFNGDIYYVAEIDGYDPLNRKKCKLKLIRKTIQ